MNFSTALEYKQAWEEAMPFRKIIGSIKCLQGTALQQDNLFGISEVTVKSCNSGGLSVVGKDQLLLRAGNNFAL